MFAGDFASLLNKLMHTVVEIPETVFGYEARYLRNLLRR